MRTYETPLAPGGTTRRSYAPSISAYLLILVVAESAIIYTREPVSIFLTVGSHFILMFILLIRSATLSAHDRIAARFFGVLALAPLVRILSFSLPSTRLAPLVWPLTISILLLAAGVTTMLVLNLSLREVGLGPLRVRDLAVQAAVALSGLVLGGIRILIILPEQAWVPNVPLGEAALAGIVIVFVAGLVEEFIFRGIMLPLAGAVLGRLLGLLSVSLLFAALHIPFLSILYLIFSFLVALSFGFIVQKTGSLIGVSVAHGLSYVVVYLGMPLNF